MAAKKGGAAPGGDSEFRKIVIADAAAVPPADIDVILARSTAKSAAMFPLWNDEEIGELVLLVSLS